jgi:hypothetical protein
MATVSQPLAILGKMVPDRVVAITDINGRRGTSDAVKEQDGGQKGSHKKGLGIINVFHFIT